MASLKGKNVIITGSGQGIGNAIAKELANEGSNIAIHYFKSDIKAKELKSQLISKGVRAEVFQADLTKENEVKSFIADCVNFLGSLDVLVNNTGDLIERRLLEEIDIAYWQKIADVNITSMMLVTKYAVPELKKQKCSAIINLSSLAGRKGGHPGSLSYSTFKGAVLTWSRALSFELAPLGIRVNAIAPGFMLGTRFHATHTSEESAKETIAGIPLQRAGNSEDVARAVRFFASEYDGFITGSTLDINGGVYCA